MTLMRLYKATDCTPLAVCVIVWDVIQANDDCTEDELDDGDYSRYS